MDNILLLDKRLQDRIKVDHETGCWNWIGIKGERYGVFKPNRRKRIAAHRAVWIALRGPVPEGLELDHLCRNRLCVWVCVMATARHLLPTLAHHKLETVAKHFGLAQEDPHRALADAILAGTVYARMLAASGGKDA
jgi:HNH endonuclease